MQQNVALSTRFATADPMSTGAEVATGAALKLSIRDMCKYYGETVALDRVDLDVREGELMTLLGPSGSGKTTLLQTICGLTEPTRGQLLIDGKDRTHAPVNRRDIGVVFQNYALFPHLTVAENVAFPLKMRRLGRAEREAKVVRALEMVGLGHALRRFPTELSGGQQQRVALARCLVYDPAIILMDEPLGALDRKLRETMQIEIKRIHRETGATIVFVTHDQEEALALSDRICLMRGGRIAQLGTPREMYTAPRSVFVADFIGLSNILAGTCRGAVLETADGPVPLPPGAPAGGKGHILIRPEVLRLAAEGPLSGTVVDTVYAGSETRVLVHLPSGQELTVREPAAGGGLTNGQQARLTWAPEAALFLDREI